MPERFDKAARAGDSAKGLRHYLSRLQKARRRGNARKIAKFRPKLQKYKNALEAVVLDKLSNFPQGTVVPLQRGATQKEMRELRRLLEKMVSIQSNLQAQAYYAEHIKAIGAGEEWVYPWDEHPVVTVGSVEPGEARLILEELGRLGHVVDDDDEYLKALEQAALALADIRAMSVMHTCFRGPPFVGISPQGRTLKLALIHANCRSLFHDYNSEQAQRLRKKLLLARLRACQGVDGTE